MTAIHSKLDGSAMMALSLLAGRSFPRASRELTLDYIAKVSGQLAVDDVEVLSESGPTHL